MASYKEIFTAEKDRGTADKLNVIHLFKEGPMLKACEYSAWLAREFAVTDEQLKAAGADRLKPFHKKARNTGGTIISVGFPHGSLEKFIPSVMQTSVQNVSDKQTDIAIELPAEIGDVSPEALWQKFLEWKQQWPLVDNDEGEQQGDEADDTPKPRRPRQRGPMTDAAFVQQGGRMVTALSLVQRVATLPLEEISYEQAYQLMKEMRRDALSLLC